MTGKKKATRVAKGVKIKLARGLKKGQVLVFKDHRGVEIQRAKVLAVVTRR